MRRLFWVGVGVGLTVVALRWARKQRQRYGPEAVGTRLGDGLRDLGKLLKASIEEGVRAMDQKEAQLRAEMDRSR